MNRVGFLVAVWEPAERDVVLDGSERMRSGRDIYRMLELGIERVGWSGGTKTPSWRNDRTFDMRMRDEADGESRMIGSCVLELPFRG